MEFKLLLSPTNIHEVFYYPKEFFPQKVSRLNFEGSRDTRARERIHARLLIQIKEASTEEMVRDKLGNMYPLATPLTNPTLVTPQNPGVH